jgi:thymidylate synthase (FAD)
MANTNPWFIESSSKARLVTHTPDPEAMMGYIARVTSKDQDNPNVERLLKYCAKHGHWSVFEQASMTVEVVTPLAIAVQLLRHRSFTFQQFSGRYEDQQEMAKFTEGLISYNDLFYMPEEARDQDAKNRQNSIFTEDPSKTDAMWATMSTAYMIATQCYKDLLSRGIAKEIARFVLPQGVFTRLYVTGSCRSWIHYLNVRDDEGVAQWEHVELARSIRPIFSSVFPTVSETLKNTVSEVDRLKLDLAEAQDTIAVMKAQKVNRL